MPNKTTLHPRYHPAWLQCWPEKASMLIGALADEALKGDDLAREMLPWWIEHVLQGACNDFPYSDYSQSERERMDNG